MLRRGERPHLGLGVQRVADPDGSCQPLELVQERIGNALVQHQPRTGDAGLALVMENGPGRAVDGGVEVGIVKDNVGPFAAKFQLHALQVALRRLDDLAPGAGGARKGNLADPRMLGKALACRMPVAGHHVDHAVRKADFGHQFGNTQRRQRGQLGWLDDHRIPGRQRRPHLPAGEHERKVPRHDLPDHADRRPLHVIQKTRFHRHDRAFKLVGHAAEVAEAGGGARHIERTGIADRMARVQGFEPCQFFGVGFDGVGQLEQQPPALGGGHARPRRERARRCLHCHIDVGRLGRGNVGDDAAVVRVQHLDGGAAQCVDEAPVDKELVLHDWKGDRIMTPCAS
ncbi:hypothetical protein D9M68_357120 [compost metagenome]